MSPSWEIAKLETFFSFIRTKFFEAGENTIVFWEGGYLPLEDIWYPHPQVPCNSLIKYSVDFIEKSQTFKKVFLINRFPEREPVDESSRSLDFYERCAQPLGALIKKWS